MGDYTLSLDDTGACYRARVFCNGRETMSETQMLLIALGSVMAILGVLGTVLPMLPGLPLLACGLVLLAWVDNFQAVGGSTLAFILAVAVLGVLVDFIAGLWGAKVCGASREALWGTVMGGVLGLAFGLLGLVLGPLLGAVLGELVAQRGLWQTGKVGLATVLGLIVGTFAKLMAAVIMLGVFATAYWW